MKIEPLPTQISLSRTSSSFKGRRRRRQNILSQHGAQPGQGLPRSRSPGQDSMISNANSRTASLNIQSPNLRPSRRLSTLSHVDSSSLRVEPPALTLKLREASTSPFPDSPEDVSQWMLRRRESARQSGGAGTHPALRESANEDGDGNIPVFELDDTSPARSSLNEDELSAATTKVSKPDLRLEEELNVLKVGQEKKLRVEKRNPLRLVL